MELMKLTRLRTKVDQPGGIQRGARREGKTSATYDGEREPEATAARPVFQEDNNFIRPILSARFDSI